MRYYNMKQKKIKDLPLELREFAIVDENKNVRSIIATKESVEIALLSQFEIKFDSFKQQIYIDGKIYDPSLDYDDLADSLCRLGFKITNQLLQLIRRRVLNLAKQNCFDSGIELLNKIPKWDKIDRWQQLANFLHIDNPLWGKFLFISIVYRLMHPEGVQHQFMHILHGDQGCGKSSFFELISLNQDMFSRDVDFYDSTDCIARAIKGISVVEIPELLGKRSKSDDFIKTMLSKSSYQYRPLYTEPLEKVTLRNVFCGSTNEQNFLTDQTGNRRFIVEFVKGQIELFNIQCIKEKLYAQAIAEVNEYKKLVKEVIAYNEKNNQIYEVRSVYYEILMKFKPEDLHLKTSTEILINCLGVQAKEVTQKQLNEVVKAMRNLGFSTFLKRINGKMAKCWYCNIN